MSGAEQDLDAVAARLYAGPAAGFVAARTAEAKAARAAGDRDLAARIGALEKPSAAAALVNGVVRDGGDDLSRVLDLGAELRRAQQDGDAVGLRRLGADRRRLLADVAERAAARAAQDGRRPGEPVLEELRQTLQAAMASEAAADAVRGARLVHALTADDLGPPAAAGPRSRSGEQRAAAEAAAAAASREADEAAARQAAAEAVTGARAAEVDALRADLAAAVDALDAARGDLERAQAVAARARAAATAAVRALG